jgi:hypothetical protein
MNAPRTAAAAQGHVAHRNARAEPARPASVDAENLERYLFRSDDARLSDLTTLMSEVRYADRAYCRELSKGWRRELTVDVRVTDPDFWKCKELQTALTDALSFLTGDSWAVRFSRRPAKRVPFQRHLVEPPAQARVFMPYSNGLDSRAIATELRRRSSAVELVLVNLRAKDKPTTWDRLSTGRGAFKVVQVATYSPDPADSEPTFRSRAFTYALLSGYAAGVSQPAQVWIPENGQGSLGGSLAPLGIEAPHRSCHPGFTKRLSKVVGLLTGHEVHYEHPALFETKGQVLRRLWQSDSESTSWLADHRSCSYDARQTSREGKLWHCGVCGNCLLRRMSLLWAGIEDTTGYLAKSIRVPRFVDSFGHLAPRSVKAQNDVAFNTVRSMQRLADLVDDMNGMRVQAEAAALARGLNESVSTVTDRLEDFLKQHRIEWQQFLDHCGPRSWVAQYART